jgi:hypothetical protein
VLFDEQRQHLNKQTNEIFTIMVAIFSPFRVHNEKNKFTLFDYCPLANN